LIKQLRHANDVLPLFKIALIAIISGSVLSVMMEKYLTLI